MENWSALVLDYVRREGACAAGIATIETLEGGPPSADLTYVLPQAKSAVSFALPLDQDLIPPFLMKKDRISHERNNLQTNSLASGIALNLSKFLEQKGYPSVPIAANEVYRTDTGRGAVEMLPDISLRYLAVRSGVGHFGLSGNVITRENGAAVILGGVVTALELEPTDPIPPEDKYCDECRLCMASCASGMMSPEELTRITLGGVEFTYSKRRNYLRCEFVCGGFTGLHPSGRWSTWSPGRFPVPERDEDLTPVVVRAMKAYSRWPEIQGGHHHVLMRGKLYLTCGNCQLICHPEREERMRRYRMLVESGVVVQNPDGSLEALSPETARERISRMSHETRSLYEFLDL